MSHDTAYLEYEIELSHADAQILSIALDEGAIPDLSGYYEVLYDEERKSPDKTSLMLYFVPGQSLPGVEIEILMASLSIACSSIVDRTVDRDKYLEAYKEHYRSFPVSKRFIVVPSWEKGTEREKEHSNTDSIPLYLDPGLAFGTGLHPTSRMCLAYLDEKLQKDSDVIDAGCGSGILSVGALLLGAKKVFAFDVDNNAVRSSYHNLSLNSAVSGELIVKSGGFDLPEFESTTADLLIGNLTWNIIKANAGRINAGHYPAMILSGILVDRANEVVEFFSDHWKLLDKKELEGWSMLEFSKIQKI